ncbi:MAG: hypothetical protein HQ568_07715 [Calditrichaeota bacterium]|nr:hypothetical protein [Calditrichota bacterium]
MKADLKREKLLADLAEIAERLFTEVRQEQGSFLSGSCIINGDRILIINKRQSLDERITVLAREISDAGTDKLYIKPAIRAEINRYTVSDQ